MKRLTTLLFLILAACCCTAFAQTFPEFPESPDLPQPDTTLCFAQRDTCDLLLDFYAAAPNTGPCANFTRKPVIVHVFGGAFVTGKRNHPNDRPWYRALADAGYHVVTIDYRLGMKGAQAKGPFSGLEALENAIQIAVDDLFAATNYLIDNAEALGLDPDRIIVSGSSAGAITALQAEWEICNRKEPAQVLPGWFNYAGVMSFAGAILSRREHIRFPQKPCPVLLLHGTADRIVPYGKITLFRMQWAGSFALAKKLADAGTNYQLYRFKGIGHEVAASMRRNLPEELRFLEENVIKDVHRTVDALVDDAGIPDYGWSKLSALDLY